MKQKSREALARAAGILTGIIFSIVKKHQEDARKAVEEAVNREEKEQWINEHIQRIEREFDERIEGVMRYVRKLEERVEEIDHIKDPVERNLRRWRR